MKIIPTENDWGDWRADVDQKFAHNLYIGKSNEEMNERYLIGPIEVFSELHFIAKIPFQYYVIGFRDSVLSKAHSDSIDMSSAAYSFMRLLEVRTEDNIGDILEIENELMPAARYIADHQEEFGADLDTYGDFKIIVEKIQMALRGTR